MSMHHKISAKNAPHYKWGQDCDGWYLLKNKELTIIEEQMPAGTAESLHYHKKAQQLFYILSGEAVFEIGHEQLKISAGESIHVPPGVSHKIYNNDDKPLRFLVISSPESQGDRFEK